MPAPSSPTFQDDRTRVQRQRLKPRDTLVRAAVSELLRGEPRPGFTEPIAHVIDRHYDGCLATKTYVERAAVSPANTTTATWAAELVQASTADFLAGPTGASSAFASLAQRAMTVTLPLGTGSIKIPSRASPSQLVGSWIGESGAKPITTIPLTSVNLVPCKLAAISVFSEELLMHSTPSIETVVTQTLRRDLSGLLDTALLDATAASSVRPAGLFNGATSVTASAATLLNDAMLADLKALAAAVLAGNPDAAIAYVCNPQQAIRINMVSEQPLDNLIVSGYMPTGNVGCVDTSAVALTISQPVFAQSRSAALHMDTAATALAAAGATTISAPASSMYQTDTVALRSLMRVGFVKCRATAAALVTGVTW